MGSACVKKKSIVEEDESTPNKYLKENDDNTENMRPHIQVTTASSAEPSSNANVSDSGKPCTNDSPPQLRRKLSSSRSSVQGQQPIKSGLTENDQVASLALSKLRNIMKQLDEGNIDSVADMRSELSHAMAMIDSSSNRASTIHDYRSSACELSDIDEELENSLYSDGMNEEVREWIATTFARPGGTIRRKSCFRKHTFRSVVNAVKASLYVNRIYQSMSERTRVQVPAAVQECFKSLDDWSFDVFHLSEASDNHPLRYVGHELFNRYELFSKFKISVNIFDRFILALEDGYKKYSNPYHNECHAADVTHTVHYFLSSIGLVHTIADLEVFALLLSAMIHDVEHTGTTNLFHINSRSELALLYNDRSVLENHHISAAFTLMKEDDLNILANFSYEQFMEVRSLVVDMVLATDMSVHFEQIRNMKVALSSAPATTGGPQPFRYISVSLCPPVPEVLIDTSKGLQLLLHVADISNPAQRWTIHTQWTDRLMEEFFQQGDLEVELQLPISPLCDRSATLIPESQVGFIDFIVTPAFEICSELLDVMLGIRAPNCSTNDVGAEEDSAIKAKDREERPWVAFLSENRKNWKELCLPVPKNLGEDSKTTSNITLTSNKGSILNVAENTRDESTAVRLKVNHSPQNSRTHLVPSNS